MSETHLNLAGRQSPVEPVTQLPSSVTKFGRGFQLTGNQLAGITLRKTSEGVGEPTLKSANRLSRSCDNVFASTQLADSTPAPRLGETAKANSADNVISQPSPAASSPQDIRKPVPRPRNITPPKTATANSLENREQTAAASTSVAPSASLPPKPAPRKPSPPKVEIPVAAEVDVDVDAPASPLLNMPPPPPLPIQNAVLKPVSQPPSEQTLNLAARELGLLSPSHASAAESTSPVQVRRSNTAEIARLKVQCTFYTDGNGKTFLAGHRVNALKLLHGNPTELLEQCGDKAEKKEVAQLIKGFASLLQKAERESAARK